MTGGGYGPAGGGSPSAPALRPLGVGETLDTALRVYRNNAVTLWKIVAIVIVPLEVIDVILRRVALPSGVFLHNGSLYVYSSTGSSGSSGTGPLIIASLLGFLAQLLASGAMFKLLIDHYLGRNTTWGESFAYAWSRFGALLWLAILTVVFVSIGFVLLVIPGIWLVVAVSVAVPALMYEGVGGFAAMKRSISLVDKHWWATFLRLLVAFILYVVASFIIGAIVGGLAAAFSVGNVTLYEIIYGILRALVVILLTPFTAAVVTVIYIDLRVRKEALDIELLAQGFDSSGPPPLAAPGGLPAG